MAVDLPDHSHRLCSLLVQGLLKGSITQYMMCTRVILEKEGIKTETSQEALFFRY